MKKLALFAFVALFHSSVFANNDILLQSPLAVGTAEALHLFAGSSKGAISALSESLDIFSRKVNA